MFKNLLKREKFVDLYGLILIRNLTKSIHNSVSKLLKPDTVGGACCEVGRLHSICHSSHTCTMWGGVDIIRVERPEFSTGVPLDSG